MPDEQKPEEPKPAEPVATSAADLVDGDTDVLPGATEASPTPEPPPNQNGAHQSDESRGRGRPMKDDNVDERVRRDRERWRRGYYSRKAKQSGAGPLPPREPIPPRPPPPPVDYDRMAALLVQATLGIAVQALGDEWAPRVVRLNQPDKDGNFVAIDERAALNKATADYLRSRDMKDIPPGLMLCIVCIGYAMPRFTQPTTRAKVGGLVRWVKSLWPFGRKNAAPAPDRNGAASKEQERQMREARKVEVEPEPSAPRS